MEGADRIARRQRAAIDGDVADRPGAAERAAGIDGDDAIDGAVHRERAAENVPVLRAGTANGPVRAANLVEGRKAVILIAGADQAEIEAVLAGAAELKRVRAV